MSAEVILLTNDVLPPRFRLTPEAEAARNFVTRAHLDRIIALAEQRHHEVFAELIAEARRIGAVRDIAPTLRREVIE